MTGRVAIIRTAATVVAALVVLVPASQTHAATGFAPGRPDAKRAVGWTSWIDADLSAPRLGLSSSAPAPRLARAALRRNAARLGLDRSLAGVRLVRRLETPARDGARAFDQLRFRQQVGRLRLVWSQIDVTVAAGTVRSIAATVVPVGRGRAAGERRVSRTRALAIARRAVAGPDEALRPLPVAYVGAPTSNRAAGPRRARRAWVVEVRPASEEQAEAPTGLCIVIDAETGKVIGRWPGIADRPDRALDSSTARASASTTTPLWIGDASQIVDPLSRVKRYAEFAVTGDPRDGRNWLPWPDGILVPSSQRTTLMDALTANARNVVRTVCDVRGFCPGFQVAALGNDPATDVKKTSFADRFRNSFSIRDTDVMEGNGDPDQPSNDIVAHEHGHLVDFAYAGDRASGQSIEGLAVAEALADMFAYDYDFGDATLGEERFNQIVSRSWERPQGVSFGDRRYPAHMDDYDPTPPVDINGDPSAHFNSTILSHAYYLFVQRIGRDKAGAVLHTVPQRLSPRPTFDEVRRAVTQSAHALYGGLAAQDAIEAFIAVGLVPPPPDEPDCGPEAC